MKTSKEAVQILNDLIQINNDRITGYERAIKELKDNDDDLKALFAVFIDQSRQNKMILGKEVQSFGEDMDNGTTAGGKIYRAWMDVKAVFTGHDRHTVLENCEFGEDSALKAYHTALRDDDLPAYLKEIVSNQHQMLIDAHRRVRSLRDEYVHQ
jgi:uncharacterized protein (TIGR02284 family)